MIEIAKTDQRNSTGVQHKGYIVIGLHACCLILGLEYIQCMYCVLVCLLDYRSKECGHLLSTFGGVPSA